MPITAYQFNFARVALSTPSENGRFSKNVHRYYNLPIFHLPIFNLFKSGVDCCALASWLIDLLDPTTYADSSLPI